MNDVLLSIVIPAFKVEAFIERCVRSLQRQDLDLNQFEIVVVNDGSPDRSDLIVEGLSREFSNVHLYNQENKGVSVARNVGLGLAKGTYVIFIDPDDYVKQESLGRPVSFAIHHHLDALILGYEFLDVDGNVLSRVIPDSLDIQIISGIEAYHQSHGAGKVDPDRSWAILFKREFLNRNQLRYLPGVPYLEDGEFIARTMCLATKVSFWNEVVYERTTRPGSATNSNLFTEQRSIFGFIQCAQMLRNFRANKSLPAKGQEFLNQPIAKFVLLAIQACISPRSIKYLTSTIQELRKLGFSRLERKGTTPPYRQYAGLYNFSPKLFIVFYAGKLLVRRQFVRS